MRRLDGQRPRPRIGWSRVAPPQPALCRECGLRYKQHAGLCRQCQCGQAQHAAIEARERCEVRAVERAERGRLREAARVELQEKPARVVVADGVEFLVVWDGSIHP